MTILQSNAPLLIVTLIITLTLAILGVLSLFFGYLKNSTWRRIQTPTGTREYILKQPNTFFIQNPGTATAKKPLIVALHGYSDHPRITEFYTGWSRKADQNSFFVVYPKGTLNPQNNTLSWNAGMCCNIAVEQNVPDVDFIDQLIQELQNELPIDKSKIYIAGFSNGGMMAQRFAAERPNRVSAVGVMAGAAGGSVKMDEPDFINEPTGPVNVIFLHGQQDTVVPIKGGLNEQKDARFISLEETVNLWRKANGCTESSQTEQESNTALQKHILHTCPNGIIEVHELKTVGHIWSGWILDAVRKPWARQVNATEVIWQFFQKNQKNSAWLNER